MDGVLVDSESFMSQAAIIMFAELGVKALTKDFEPFVGMGENKYIGGVANKYGVVVDIELAKSRAYEIYGEIVRGKLNPLPGAKAFVAQCRNKGFKLALASSADRVKIDINLKETGISSEVFQTIISGLDVKNKKPAPDIYLKAAMSLSLNPEECLVVEDAVSGIQAGMAAGCKCLAVKTTVEESKLKEADWICDSLLSVPEEALVW